MRKETVTRTLYKFDELSPKAKEKARDWYREGNLDYDWWEFTYDDAKSIGLRITGFDCQRGTITGNLLEPARVVAKLIIEDHGSSCGTYKLADKFKSCKCNEDGDDCEHEGEFERALLKEYLKMLNNEVEYMQSDEAVDEGILANEYEFTEDGKRA